MIVVIIAGGSGTRLWPLSTKNFPKHLLKLIGSNSLLQNTVARVQPFASQVFVVSEASHIEHVYSQLPEIDKKNILVEPARRGTASCIIYALSEIKKRSSGPEPILFLWADHLIRDVKGFAAAAELSGQLSEEKEKLVFMGVEPTYPSTGFGYMEKGLPLPNGHKNIYELKQFVEKPDRTTAEHYFQSGDYLWNMGYLTGTLKVFEREMEQHAPRLWSDYQALLKTKDVDKTYLEFVNEPIDTALSEHVPDALVVPGVFDWVDVGSFQDLHTVSSQDEDGNHVIGAGVELEHVSNSYIRNEQGALPVAVVGLDNVAIVVSQTGILVTNKTYAQKVGDVAKRIQS